jgi:hypothetical protein
MREFTKSDFHIYQCGKNYELVFDGKILAIGSFEHCEIELENVWDEYCDGHTEAAASAEYENHFY